MSDFHRVKQKTQEGADWRGTISVEMDGEMMELQIRHLKSPEFEEIMRLINRDELKELRDLVPSDVREEYNELQEKEEDLTEKEEERLRELQEEMDEAMGGKMIFDVLSSDTFEGIRRCGIYCVEPDEEDLQREFRERAGEIEEEYGIPVRVPEDVYPAVKDDLEDMVRNSTNFIGLTIGLQALMETVDDEGN